MKQERERGTGNGERVAVVADHDLRFRTADAGDVAAIVALTESAYRGDSSRAGWTTEADLLDGQRTDADEVGGLLADAGTRVLLAERQSGDARELLACCVLQHMTGEHVGDAYFGMFSVRPALQGHGTGSALLAEAERVVRDDWHCPSMRMTVIDARVELVAWYERHGYRRTGEHRPFPYGDARFGIPKRDDLRFEWLVKELRGAAAVGARSEADAATHAVQGGARG